MGKLSTAERDALPASDFLDPVHRRFPAEDASHLRAARTYGISRAKNAGSISESFANQLRAKANARAKE